MAHQDRLHTIKRVVSPFDQLRERGALAPLTGRKRLGFAASAYF